MRLRSWVLAAGVLLQALSAEASQDGTAVYLRAYGPGGPHHVLQECADLYRRKSGVTVQVDKGSPAELARKVQLDGDIYFGGAEYMLEEFARRNPGVLDLHSAEKLHARRIGVVVRRGNPLGIRGVDCLERPEVSLLGVELENMGRYHASPGAPGGNVRRRVRTGQEGVAAWRSFPEIDAWVTYRSWHVELEEESEFVEIPGDEALRYTPVALTARSRRRAEARQFIEFLKSPQARRVFVEHGGE